MAVAGYFLVQGLSQFSGSGTTNTMLIVGGVLFQVTESICFIGASALTYHSLRWRYILFTLGVVLFSFSIGVMTLAQKAALQTGESQASAIDEKRQYLRSQIASLQKVIDSYRLNAEKQSRSIYKDSRAKGQDSLNRAAKLEQKKMQLSEALYRANIRRKQTSSDFFKRVEQVTGLPAASTEFYFLVGRSLLIELSAIILMSFGANLRAYNKLVMDSRQHLHMEFKEPLSARLRRRLGQKTLAVSQDSTAPAATQTKAAQVMEQSPPRTAETVTQRDHPAEEEPVPENQEVRPQAQGAVPADQLNMLADAVVQLYEKNLISTLGVSAVIQGVSRYCNQKISPESAEILSKMASSRLDEPC